MLFQLCDGIERNYNFAKVDRYDISVNLDIDFKLDVLNEHSERKVLV